MRINPVQNYNNNHKPAFKSQVRLHHSDVISVDRTLFKNKILKGIKTLQKNGNDDRVFVELYEGTCAPHILLNVVKKDGEKLLAGTARSIWGDSPADMYEEAIKDMKPIEDNPLYLGLNKVHMFFNDMKRAGKDPSFTKELIDFEKTVKNNESVSIELFHNLWTNITMHVIRKNGKNYTEGWEIADRNYCDSLKDVYKEATKEMEPSEEYNNNPLYFKL